MVGLTTTSNQLAAGHHPGWEGNLRPLSACYHGLQIDREGKKSRLHRVWGATQQVVIKEDKYYAHWLGLAANADITAVRWKNLPELSGADQLVDLLSASPAVLPEDEEPDEALAAEMPDIN